MLSRRLEIHIIRITARVDAPKLVKVKAHKRVVNGKVVKVKAHYRRG